VRENGKVAFVFPGQGSQYVGMGRDLFETFPAAKDVFNEADESLGNSLSHLCFSGPEADLKLTENTQPAILTVSIAALKVFESEYGLKADYAAGHSLGEYSAYVSVGALGFADAVRVVRERGRFMQEAVLPGRGSMAAIIGLESHQVSEICKKASEGQVVSPANLNGAEQVVISGETHAVKRAMELARNQGAKRVVELPVSAPFHCSLMQSAAEKLAVTLNGVEIRPFATPVIANVTVGLNDSHEKVKELLVDQVISPVRWEESVKRLVELGCKFLVEIGPGRVLSGLARRIASEMEVYNLEKPQDLSKLKVLVEKAG